MDSGSGKKTETAQLFVISSSISFPIVICLSLFFFASRLVFSDHHHYYCTVALCWFVSFFQFTNIKKDTITFIMLRFSVRPMKTIYLVAFFIFGSVIRLNSVTHDVQYFMRIADNVSFAPLFILSNDHLMLSDIFFCALNILA